MQALTWNHRILQTDVNERPKSMITAILTTSRNAVDYGLPLEKICHKHLHITFTMKRIFIGILNREMDTKIHLK